MEACEFLLDAMQYVLAMVAKWFILLHIFSVLFECIMDEI